MYGVGVMYLWLSSKKYKIHHVNVIYCLLVINLNILMHSNYLIIRYTLNHNDKFFNKNISVKS